MRTFAVFFFVAMLCSSLDAKEFRPVDAKVVFSVTEETLETMPAWTPGSGQLPVSAADAIQIAAAFHKRIAPHGRNDTFVFDLAGATLVRAEKDRWYWVVQYRVHYDPVAKRNGIGGGWVGPMPKQSLYPVLLNGKLAPHQPISRKMPAAIQPANESGGSEGADRK
ncbi:hypothetical protein [Rhodopirellula bahusiensis]|uniref:hypothetical protein n=1 Tax=Rhodopirellula bahusiensis TaxID=2014065 RepID=UPI003264232B